MRLGSRPGSPLPQTRERFVAEDAHGGRKSEVKEDQMIFRSGVTADGAWLTLLYRVHFSGRQPELVILTLSWLWMCVAPLLTMVFQVGAMIVYRWRGSRDDADRREHRSSSALFGRASDVVSEYGADTLLCM